MKYRIAVVSESTTDDNIFVNKIVTPEKRRIIVANRFVLSTFRDRRGLEAILAFRFVNETAVQYGPSPS